MRMLACFMLMIASFTTFAQDKIGMPTVTWHGQSFFTIRASDGSVIAFDPHLIPAFGRPEGIKPDVVLLSHLHSDHTNLLALDNVKEKSLRIISGLTGSGRNTNWADVDVKIKDAHIRSIPSYHDDAQGMNRGKNSIFLVDVDGWRFCHLGDLGHQLTPAQLKRIGEVDVLMVPVGGIYTLNGSEAKRVVEQIKPREYIFPMHFGTKEYDEVLPIDEFLDEQDKTKVAVSDTNAVTLNKDAQRPRPLIVQLSPTPRRK